MVEFNIKVHEKQGTAYLPKEIRKAFGTQLKLLPNAEAGLLYREDARLETVLKSLQVIKQDLENRIETKQQKADK